MEANTRLIPLLERIAEDWNRAGVEYAVTHGISDYPRTLGRDIDVLFRSGDVHRALEIARDAFAADGYSVACPNAVWGPRLVGVLEDHGSCTALEIHGVTAVSWKNVCFRSKPQSRDRIGPIQVDPWASFAKRVLVPLLSEGTPAFDRRPDDFCFESEHEAVETAAGLATWLSPGMACGIIRAVESKSPHVLKARLGQLRTAFVLSALRSEPCQSVARLARLCGRRIKSLHAPCGPVIALIGPDGVGKSSTISRLNRSSKSIFTKVIVHHWRPGILPLRRHSEDWPGNSRMGGWSHRPVMRRALGYLGHWPRLLYYFADYVLGHFFGDLQESGRQRLTIYDRWAVDMYVDPRRYALNSRRGTLLLCRLVPKPDLVVLLSGSPSEIHARKPELTIEQIEEHLRRSRALMRIGLVDCILDVDGTADQAAARLLAMALRAFVKKNLVNGRP